MTPDTPLWTQYHALKAVHPDAILFFRMGDFYEMFFDDAVVAARILDLTLTSRNKQDENPVPMAGVPHHAAAAYIQKLVDQGHRVAIGEQIEDPAVAKGIVKRAIVRVVTPGVAWDPTMLDKGVPVRLCAVARDVGGWGVAFLDPSTGDLRVTTVPDVAAAAAEIHRLEPREALLEPGADDPTVLGALKRHHAVTSRIEDEAWERREALRELRTALDVHDLTGFGLSEDEPAARAAGVVLRYARDMSGGALRNVSGLTVYRAAGFMVVDDASRRNLELFRTLLGHQRKGTLLWLVDRTATGPGARLLRDWLSFPLLDVDEIAGRQAAVAALVDEGRAREDLRTALEQIADIERILARVSQGTAHPKDLAALRRSLQAVPRAVQPLRSLLPLRPLLPEDVCGDVAQDLDRWLADDPPLTTSEGGIVRRGAHPELDRLTDLALEGMGVIAKLEEREKEATGIASLKIRRNSVFGYFIEVTRAQVHRVPDRYLRKQTLTTGERYVTAELKEFEEQVLGADAKRIDLEKQLFVELRERVAEQTDRLLAVARSIARLDVLQSLAEVAVERRWTRPVLDGTRGLDLRGARHPVVEALLEDERFVPNDVVLEPPERRLVVLTGPNMAGKSTVLRQTALIALLAQIGSFVPADSARIGVVDRIFTRVGAVDDLGRGQSTFMVEMAETAAILHGATDRSLVILDEIGRGTSTYDGLSIAWAVAERLHAVGCRTLFATHYHELCALAEQKDGVVNQSVAVHESGDRIVFLRKLKDGGASRSYGIQCARLAGLPNEVIERAKELLKRFEKGAPRNDKNQLSLFGVVQETVVVEKADELRVALGELDPDALTPRQALDALYKLKKMAREG